MTLYGMPPDDPSSLVPENTIRADSRGAFEQELETPRDDDTAEEEEEE